MIIELSVEEIKPNDQSKQMSPIDLIDVVISLIERSRRRSPIELIDVVNKSIERSRTECKVECTKAKINS